MADPLTAFTVRLSEDVAAKLDALAFKLERSRSYVAARAINDFIAREAWQLADIEAGVEEAGRDEFASEADVARVFAKYAASPDSQ